MAANVLSSRRAIEVSVFVVRAFIRLRDTLAAHKELAKKLEDLERKTAALALKHDALASDTRAQFREVIEALRHLMSPREPAPTYWLCDVRLADARPDGAQTTLSRPARVSHSQAVSAFLR
jgi:hypothetical protein